MIEEDHIPFAAMTPVIQTHRFWGRSIADLVKDIHYQEVAWALLLDPEQKNFFQRHNPAALEEATERLLEAAERGLWKCPDKDTVSALESNLFELQGLLE